MGALKKEILDHHTDDNDKNRQDAEVISLFDKNRSQKDEIKKYQDVIQKTLEDPEMAKKAAFLLIEMLEEKRH